MFLRLSSWNARSSKMTHSPTFHLRALTMAAWHPSVSDALCVHCRQYRMGLRLLSVSEQLELTGFITHLTPLSLCTCILNLKLLPRHCTVLPSAIRLFNKSCWLYLMGGGLFCWSCRGYCVLSVPIICGCSVCCTVPCIYCPVDMHVVCCLWIIKV